MAGAGDSELVETQTPNTHLSVLENVGMKTEPARRTRYLLVPLALGTAWDSQSVMMMATVLAQILHFAADRGLCYTDLVRDWQGLD